MRALFVTTRTGDCGNHVRAWESFAGAADVVFHTPAGIPNDLEILRHARACQPKVIFYIGAPRGPGCPMPGTFRLLRDIAPTINICSDAVDEGWHEALAEFRAADCFDLHVAIDGAENRYIDLSTVTPIDPRAFEGPPVERDIHCGFSGGFGSKFSFDYSNHDAAYRGKVMQHLLKHRLLTVRQREATGAYADHVAFMRRCQIVVNVSFCGSATAHQIKGRAIEAGWAGCALLESAGSPTIGRFPPGAVIPFETLAQARNTLRTISDDEIARSAAALAGHVRTHCHPRAIYGEMLERVGLTL